LAKLYYEWAQSQNQEVKNATYRFIIERVLACITKYYQKINYNGGNKERAQRFKSLCQNKCIKNAVDEVSTKEDFELKKDSLVYLISVFLLKRKKYKMITYLYKVLKSY
jgi:hypothetical protein